MKLIHKEQRENWKTKTASAYEYPFGTKNIDCAVVEVFGRHPIQGWFRNTKVDEMIYCKSGYGKIVFQNEVQELREDDAVLIEKNEWYYWDSSTKGIFVPVCNPAWSKEQGENKEF